MPKVYSPCINYATHLVKDNKKNGPSHGDKMSMAVILFAIMALSYFSFMPQQSFSQIALSYSIILLQSRSSLFPIRNFRGAILLRRIIRLGIYLLPLVYWGWPRYRSLGWGVPVGLIFGAVMLLPRFSELKLNLSADYLAILPPLAKQDKFRESTYLLLGSAAQEFFYRGFVITLLKPEIGVWAILVSALLFSVEHIIQFTDYDKLEYLLQTILGLGLGIIFFYSRSLAGSVWGHISYNLPGIVQIMRRQAGSNN